MRISSVDNNVSLIEKRFYQVDGPVHRCSGFDQENYLPWPFQRPHKLLRSMRAQNLLPGLTRDKCIEHRWFAIVERNWITVAFDVKSEVLAHHAKANHSNAGSF